MNPNKDLWEKGDFSKLAATMRGSADQLVGELGITPGMKVLDLALVLPPFHRTLRRLRFELR